MRIKSKPVDQQGLERIVTRISHEILEKNKGSKNLAIIGMRTRGEFLANRIAEKIMEIDNAELPLGVLDATLYRDDFRTRLKQPEISVSNITFDLNEKDIRDYLNHLSLKQNVSYSTQNQALNAIIFMYKHVIIKDIDSIKFEEC